MPAARGGSARCAEPFRASSGVEIVRAGLHVVWRGHSKEKLDELLRAEAGRKSEWMPPNVRRRDNWYLLVARSWAFKRAGGEVCALVVDCHGPSSECLAPALGGRSCPRGSSRLAPVGLKVVAQRLGAL